jgi:glycosyltransferase involved in cell wall biosynthesis
MLGVADSDFVAGIVARFSAQKAQEVLFRAIAACVESVPLIQLVVIGGGDRELELRDLAQNLGIGTRTTFLGIRRDVADLLPGLNVACLSSVHEGVPIALIEAMAGGLPIMATDCGSVRDIVEDGEQGFVVPVGDVENFADRLQRLAHQEPLRSRLGKSGRARVEREFQIQNTARGYEELLTDMLARKR